MDADPERDRLRALCAQRLAERDMYVVDSGPWLSRNERWDEALADLFALGPIDV